MSRGAGLTLRVLITAINRQNWHILERFRVFRAIKRENRQEVWPQWEPQRKWKRNNKVIKATKYYLPRTWIFTRFERGKVSRGRNQLCQVFGNRFKSFTLKLVPSRWNGALPLMRCYTTAFAQKAGSQTFNRLLEFPSAYYSSLS